MGEPLHVAVRFAYDGVSFAGYARQPEGGTVEDALIQALGSEGLVEGSWRPGSRTDRGVSALENVAACRLQRPHVHGLIPSLQPHVPDGLWLTGAAIVPATWNPRHAMRRTYGYVAPRRPEQDPERLAAACRVFVGHHDMRAFARLEAHRDPLRHVYRFDAEPSEAGEATWHFTVEGNGFLWNQVRRMVHAALVVAEGHADPADIRNALGSGAAHPKFGMATATGLLLKRVAYDPEPAWEAAAGRIDPRALRKQRVQADLRSSVLDHVATSAVGRPRTEGKSRES